jgi:hypothetical protein
VTIHYHGTPITPIRVLETLAGEHFCVSYSRPTDLVRCAKIGQSLMLDNGAFSAWTQGKPITDWKPFYDWAMPWLDGPAWLVLPDVVGGDWRETAKLIGEAPNELWRHQWKAAPVWHLHDPIERLLDMADWWPKICFGSSAEYAKVGSDSWHRRVTLAFNELTKRHRWTQVHMLRGMRCVRWGYPFYSVDSTDVARNHKRPQNTALGMARGWDALQCPISWSPQPTEEGL